MFDLDRAVNGKLNELKPLGAIKITTEKFYRISGGTTQLQGVVPDVALPGPYDQIEIGEKEYENALSIDYVERANYNEEASRKKGYEKVIKRSIKRTAEAPAFDKYKEYAAFIAEGDKDQYIPLNYEAFSAYQDSLRTISEAYKNLGKATDSMAVAPLPYQLSMFETDSVQKDIYHKWFTNLSKDIILRESTNILNDMVK